ncbi:MAG TPA: hypothetical protein IGS17_02715 [Oscillatoriales cyanobacterium M59_W2019_021]|nr:hypothetical protein [Oscillatoriales cyanobacterium M4454_W2019_049]HIK49826.1 hypothetical protein [Oscillatoriales cyanobacterium M59_W2019_021]
MTQPIVRSKLEIVVRHLAEFTASCSLIVSSSLNPKKWQTSQKAHRHLEFVNQPSC